MCMSNHIGGSNPLGATINHLIKSPYAKNYHSVAALYEHSTKRTILKHHKAWKPSHMPTIHRKHVLRCRFHVIHLQTVQGYYCPTNNYSLYVDGKWAVYRHQRAKRSAMLVPLLKLLPQRGADLGIQQACYYLNGNINMIFSSFNIF